MDKLSLLGLIVGFGAVLIGQAIGGGSVVALLSLPACFIVVGGTIGAVLLQTPYNVLKRSLSQLLWIIRPPKVDSEESIEKVLHWSNLSRHNGLLSLENSILDEEDPFIRKGMTLLVDGVEADTIRYTMDIDMVVRREQHLDGAKVYEAMGGYSPTIGIIGAVLGLIDAMNYLTEPELLGVGVATAFVATIYGVGFANLIYLPIANKIRYHAYNLSNYQELMVEGLVSVARGENPRNIEMRLKAFIEE